MNRFYIAKALRTKVAAQARYRCGYCLTSQEYSGAFLEIEHLVPLKLGGTSVEENLWLACGWCNRYKSFKGKNLFIHCQQGIGRSALIVACLLISSGMETESAFQKISAARGVAVPETPEQRKWVATFEREAVKKILQT